MKKIKVFAILAFAVGTIGALAVQSVAYPPFLAKAKKFGAKDCRFCHATLEGGPPFNARGKWLISEKERRNADAVDPEWLVDYKAGKSKKK
ncbi:MAG TPA: hypothetical protein VJZ26_01475 [Blastocatellia bacterium]|nr:hypothetical protein [Blastocatellia bacterium]